MKKKRIRYSQLEPSALSAPPAAVVPVEPVEARTRSEVATEQIPIVPQPATGSSVAPRPRRISTPVELARALTAVHEAANAASVSPTPSSAPTTEELVELLMFRVGLELFAVELLAVEEVIDLPVIHHVPEMPPAMLGVVVVRGSLTPVYSPHRALGLPLALGEAVLIFRRGWGGKRVGVLIDDVEDAISADLRELRRAPSAEKIDGVVLGVLRHAGEIVAVVDADALIAACQIAALQETA